MFQSYAYIQDVLSIAKFSYHIPHLVAEMKPFLAAKL